MPDREEEKRLLVVIAEENQDGEARDPAAIITLATAAARAANYIRFYVKKLYGKLDCFFYVSYTDL